MRYALLRMAFLSALACGGCRSAPVRHHTLTPALTTRSSPPSVVCCTVEIKNVRIPMEVDRAELVTRRSDAQLDVLDNELWLAPLRDEVRSALLDRIRRKLDASAAADGSTASQRFFVAVEVERFESVPAQHALIQARWTVNVSNPSGAAMPTCQTTVSISVDSGIDALVLGHQQAISSIADQIEANIIGIRNGGAISCGQQ